MFVSKAAVVGGGTMGGEIAQAIAAADIPVVVDDGAAMQLRDGGKSLLPVGMVGVRGEFHRGDVIAVQSLGGVEIARGLAGLGRNDADLVKGKNSARIEEILGPLSRTELVHRDNMVVLMGLEAKV